MSALGMQRECVSRPSLKKGRLFHTKPTVSGKREKETLGSGVMPVCLHGWIEEEGIEGAFFLSFMEQT